MKQAVKHLLWRQLSGISVVHSDTNTDRYGDKEIACCCGLLEQAFHFVELGIEPNQVAGHPAFPNVGERAQPECPEWVISGPFAQV